MDLAARIQQLEDLVKEAKSMPLSSSLLVNKEEILELVAEMKEELPEEIKQARWIVKDREELLAKARLEAESLVEQARREQVKMAREEEVVERAKHEAERLLELADSEGRRIRFEAEDYVDGKLAQFETVLLRIADEAVGTAHAIERTLDQVRAGREKLSGATMTTAEQELGAGAEPELSDVPLAPDVPGAGE
jgi:cell division septum initiation protein DivIVA